MGAKPSKTNNPLGRDTRVPTEESRKWHKRLTEAKIIALHEALQKTDSTKAPIKAKRLAEELKRLVTIAIKEEAKEKEAKKGKKPAFLVAAEKKAEEKKAGKKPAKKDEKKDAKKSAVKKSK